MGCSTRFEGRVSVTPPLNPQEISYLYKFSLTRRMDRARGPYFVYGTGSHGQGRDADIRDYHSPPEGQPDLWCRWKPTEDGTAILWNGQADFPNPTQWMRYLIDHFLRAGGHALGQPGFEGFTFNHTLAGVIHVEGEEQDAVWDLVVHDNTAWGRDGTWPADEIIKFAYAAGSAGPTGESRPAPPVDSARPAISENLLLVFPEPGEGLRDVGEGGMFVMMVVPYPDNRFDNCLVDAAVLVTRPTICLNPEGEQIWTGHRKAPGWQAGHEIQDVLRQYRNEKWDRWIAAAHGGEDLSREMLAVIFLGSTDHSLWSSHESAYWTATPDDLTPDGKMFFRSLKRMFDVDPILLTFLDT